MTGQAGKIFLLVAKAFEEDQALSGETARRVVQATKTLLSNAGVDPSPLLQQFTPEGQRKITAVFS